MFHLDEVPDAVRVPVPHGLQALRAAHRGLQHGVGVVVELLEPPVLKEFGGLHRAIFIRISVAVVQDERRDEDQDYDDGACAY